MVPVRVSCPRCGASLMDETHPLDGQPSIRVVVVANGDEGVLHLSSLYGSFRFDTSMAVDQGDTVLMKCPHCSGVLVTDTPCLVCRASMVKLGLDVGGEVFFCSRRGCKGHKVELIDLERAMELLYQAARPGGARGA